jgi:VWFA-related protein
MMTGSSSASAPVRLPPTASARSTTCVPRIHLVPALCALCAAYVMTAPVSARHEPLPSTPTFHAGVNLVTVDVVVRNKKTGRLVTDLSQSDFTIEDDGRPQAISSFASVDLPQTRTTVASRQRSTAGPTVPRAGATAHADDRFIVFFINDPTISPANTVYLRDWLNRYVKQHMAANDQVAIWDVTGVLARQGFTRDRAKLEATIGRVQGTRGVFAFQSSEVHPLGALPQETRSVPPLGSSNRYTLSALHQLLDSLSAISDRRKVLVYFGGLSVGCARCGDRMGDYSLYLRDLQEAAAANVAVYPVSVTGVEGFDDIVSGGPGEASRSVLRPLPLGLEQIARDTGGVVSDQNDFDRVLARIEEEAGSYYLLGFTPGVVDNRPGDFRRLRVTVRRPGVTVQARSGYIQVPTARP